MPDKQPKTEPRKKTGRIPLRLLAIVFLTGAALMALELVGSRVLAPRFGSTIYVWGSLISIFIGALAIGYFFGGKLADIFPSYIPMGALIGLAGLYIMTLPFLSPWVCDFLGAKNGVNGRMIVLGAAFMLFALPSVLLGCVSPFAVRLAAGEIEKIGNTAGVLYAVSTLGSLVGTLLTAFVLIPEFEVTSIERVIGGLLIATAALSMLPGKPLKSAGTAALLFYVLAGAAFAYPHPKPDIEMKEGEYFIYLKDSAYHRIAVFDGPQYQEDNSLSPDYTPDPAGYFFTPNKPDSELRGKRFMQFNNYIESAIFLDLASHDDVYFGKGPVEGVTVREYPSACQYTDLLWLPLLWKPRPKRAVFIGGGGGVTQRMFVQQLPDVSVDLVEIDPAVVEVAKKYFHLDDEKYKDKSGEKRLKIHVMDGREFFRVTPAEKEFDIVILDAYTIGGQIPFHLTTREYLQEIRPHMKDDGVLLININSSFTGKLGKIFQHMYKTFSMEFKQVYVFPRLRYPWMHDTRDLEDGGNIMLIGTFEERRKSKRELLELAERYQVPIQIPIALFAEHVENYTPPEELEKILWKDVRPLTDEWAPLDTWSF
jgi:predicted membrane-bound spermidine synthase